MIDSLAAAIEASQLGAFARGSSWAYPLANLIHLLGLVLLIGAIGIVDLRIVGLFQTLPLDPLMRALTPVAIAGLLLMALSGPILFAADAAALAQSPTFGWKLSLIFLALVNALSFRSVRSGKTRKPAALERVLAATSIMLWLTVAALGRLIAYN
jgi:hypothetical protein